MPADTTIPTTLTDELVARLGTLAGQPDGVAEVVLSALGYGSITSLLAHEIVEPFDPDSDEPAEIVITEYGRQVIRACAGAPAVMPASLPSELRERLERLVGQPDGIAEVALSALASSSLAILAEHHIIRPADEEGLDEVVFTAYGRRLLAASAPEAPEQPSVAAVSAGRARAPRGGERFGGALGRMAPLGVVVRMAGPAPANDALLAFIDARLDRVPHARQRLVEPLGGLAHRWRDDEHFDLTRHVHRIVLQHADDSALFDVLGQIYSEPLDDARPPWEAWIIEGLAGGGFALAAKTRDTALTGFGAGFLSAFHMAMADAGPEPQREPTLSPGARRSSIASIAALRTTVLRSVVAASQRAVQAARAVTVAPEALRAVADQLQSVVAIARQPVTPMLLDVAPSAQRRVAFVDVPAEQVTAVERAVDATTSDVLMAAVAGALRDWLEFHGRQTDLELRGALVAPAGPSPGRHLHASVLPLPVADPDAAERLADVAAASARRGIIGWRSILALDALQECIGTVMSRFSPRAETPRAYNLEITALAKMSLPPTLFGRSVEAIHPIPLLTGDRSLAIAMMLTDQAIRVGLVGDGDALPEIGVVADALANSFDELATAVSGSDAPTGAVSAA